MRKSADPLDANEDSCSKAKTTEPFIIRTSDRKTYKNCRQLWDFGSKVRMNYEPLVQAQHFRFGTAIHAALETYYEPATWSVPRPAVQHLATAAFLESYPNPNSDSYEATEAWKLEIELGLGMLEHYYQWAPLHDDFTPLHVELEFEVPITGLNAVYQGRLDMLIEDRDGRYWIVDHKTAGSLDKSVDFLDMDEQCGSYAWALQEKLGIQVAGVIYNELLKTVPQPPKVLKSGALSVDKSAHTTYNLFLTSLVERGYDAAPYRDYLDHLASQPDRYFRRTQVHRSQRELSLLGERIALEAQEMMNPDIAIYPNPNKFSCSRCEYKQPCLAKMEGSDYQWLLNQLYQLRN